ncbi:hypothetical protein GE21DRAFT_1017419 [Neurospora crassa]|nr:hypothetical protein GE21DRAFT_1017419 [Neurospora crassa]
MHRVFDSLAIGHCPVHGNSHTRLRLKLLLHSKIQPIPLLTSLLCLIWAAILGTWGVVIATHPPSFSDKRDAHTWQQRRNQAAGILE